MALKALIFDVDGTIADTEGEGHLVAFNKAFKEVGLDWFWSASLYKELLTVTGGVDRIKYYLQHYKPSFNKEPTDEFVNDIHKLKTKYFIDIVKQGVIKLRYGIKRLLLEAKNEGLILAIATTTTLNNVYALLNNSLGNDSIAYFSIIVAGDMVKYKKPASDAYNLVLTELNLSASECFAFEDSENGIIAAKKAGINTIITTNTWTNNHNFDSALLVLNNLGEPDREFKLINSAVGSVSGFVDVAMLKEIYVRAKI